MQVVLRPEKDGELLSAEASPLRKRWGTAAPITVRIDEVAYVQVTHPTDQTCQPGWYPDPLPPLRIAAGAARRGRTSRSGSRFMCRATPQPGDYHGELQLKTSLGEVQVPLRVHVYDFALPEETHLKSALGLGTHADQSAITTCSEPADKEAVFEKYLRNFAEHRISPYSFYDYAPIDIRFVGEGTNKQAQVDFTKFDQAAARWLDEAHFNTFMLPLRGMGGGTFHSRHLGELEGFKEGTPEFARLFQDYLSQIETHLRERGWLAKAYTYWFDEPAPKDYEFVVDGMKRIKAAAPGHPAHADRAAGAGVAGARGHLVRADAEVDAGAGARAARRRARRCGGISAAGRTRPTSRSSSIIPARSCGSGRGNPGNTACRAS